MVTIDLTTPPPPAASFLDGLPRRLALTLPELRHVAEPRGRRAAPLRPRRGRRRRRASRVVSASRAAVVEDNAYAAALASLHDADDSLRRRGLITDDGIDPGLTGAIGLLATPTLALDLDVAAPGTQVKAWHRQAGNAVATPRDVRRRSSSSSRGSPPTSGPASSPGWPTSPTTSASASPRVPEEVDLPFHLVDAIGEACAPAAPTSSRC